VRERAVGPVELFYDLAVVVLVAQAAHRLAGHLTWRGLGEFAAVFTLVWIAWINGRLDDRRPINSDDTPAVSARCAVPLSPERMPAPPTRQ
jgi:hypothetical protein